MSNAIDLSLLELKYCERCGGLWLRAPLVTSAYCPPCTRVFADFPAVRQPRQTFETRRTSSRRKRRDRRKRSARAAALKGGRA